MTQGMTVPSQGGAIAATWEEKQDLIQKMYPKAKGAELELFFYTAKRMKLDPLARQIHLVTRNKKVKTGNAWSWDTISTIQVGIDGYRSIADRTGTYAGNDDPLYDEGLTQYQFSLSGRAAPKTATQTVYKVVCGVRCPFTATATWEAYAPKPKVADGESQEGEKAGGDFMWRKMPLLMLAKCAEALALRKAFPAELSGVYTDEEMHQAGQAVTVVSEIVTPVPTKLPVPALAPVAKAPAAPVPTPHPHDAVNESALEDLRQVLTDCAGKDEAERIHNRFANAYKVSPATLGEAFDLYQKTLKRLGVA